MAHFSIFIQIWQYLGKVKNPRELSRIISLGLKLKEMNRQKIWTQVLSIALHSAEVNS
jgi:hypothetical protein